MPTAVRLLTIASTASKSTHLVVRRGGVTTAFSWVKSIKILTIAAEYIFHTIKIGAT
jgi:hypothetical protein